MVEVLRALTLIDLKSIRRDEMLRWMIFIPLLMVLGFRFLIPVLADQLDARWGFDLVPYYPLLTSVIGVMAPMFIGMVIGFLLLDMRDDRTLTALQVTPLTLNGYLAYRLAVPILLGFLITLLAIPAAHLTTLPFGDLVLFSLAASPGAPIYVLLLVSLAQNKVQGMAFMKGASVLLVPPLLAYFLPGTWEVAIALDPFYWPVKLFWVLESGAPGALFYWIGGLLYQGAFLAGLLARFRTVTTR